MSWKSLERKCKRKSLTNVRLAASLCLEGECGALCRQPKLGLWLNFNTGLNKCRLTEVTITLVQKIWLVLNDMWKASNVWNDMWNYQRHDVLFMQRSGLLNWEIMDTSVAQCRPMCISFFPAPPWRACTCSWKAHAVCGELQRDCFNCYALILDFLLSG